MDGNGVYVYSYDGRLVCTPRHQGMKADTINMQTISISNDTVAIRDKTDEKGLFSYQQNTVRIEWLTIMAFDYFIFFIYIFYL